MTRVSSPISCTWLRFRAGPPCRSAMLPWHSYGVERSPTGQKTCSSCSSTVSSSCSTEVDHESQELQELLSRLRHLSAAGRWLLPPPFHAGGWDGTRRFLLCRCPRSPAA